MKRTFLLFPLLLVTSFLIGACGPSKAENASIIATSVAMTVQAQAFPTSASILPSATSANLATVATMTPVATPTNTIVAGSYTNCMSASLVSEDPPDDAIFTPGQIFFKTWHIKNTSNCTWNTSYKIIFWDGDQMGGGYTYNFPQTLPPGDSADVSIQLAAPDADGTYKGEWKLQTPDGQNFGVGSYQSSIWTQIVVVSADETPTYGITAVNYSLDRNPPNGCNTNNWYTVTAQVSFSGPIKEVILQFWHSDGFRSHKEKFEVTEATTMSFTDQWKFYIADSQGPKWIMLVQIFPTHVEYDKVNFTFSCP